MSLNEEWDWLQKKDDKFIQIQVLLQETVGMARIYTTSVTVINTNNISSQNHSITSIYIFYISQKCIQQVVSPITATALGYQHMTA